MTNASTAAPPSMSPSTFQYAFVASQASCQRPRAAQAESGTGAKSSNTPRTNSRKDFM